MIPPIEKKRRDPNIYPSWICKECAESLGYKNRFSISCYHPDICGWCEQMKTVTQPRDYSFPPFKK
jgi:hypothetical protein